MGALTRAGYPAGPQRGNESSSCYRFSVLRALLYLWALPTTLLGLPFIVLGLAGGARLRVHRGVLEIHGRAVSLFLRHCTLVSGGALAMALGHVVLGRDRAALDETRSHERVHVRQAERWGPFFLPAYVLASLSVGLHGRRWYYDNPFEIEARVLSDRGD